MGRKRKLGERTACGKLRRPAPLGPTPQHLAHRLAAGGNADTPHNYPIGLIAEAVTMALATSPKP